jgi:hypothetical protein
MAAPGILKEVEGIFVRGGVPKFGVLTLFLVSKKSWCNSSINLGPLTVCLANMVFRKKFFPIASCY